MTQVLLKIIVPTLMYILPGIIVAKKFNSTKRGIIVAISAFATPVALFFILFISATTILKPVGEGLEGWAMLSLIFSTIIGWVLGIVIPILVFRKNDRKLNKSLQPTAFSGG